MSIISDKIIASIKGLLEAPSRRIKREADNIVKNIRLGKDMGEGVSKLLDNIKNAELSIGTVEGSMKSLKSVKLSLDASKIAADISKKASSIASALNPAAAAASAATEIIIEKVKIEIADAGDVVNLGPALIDNFKKEISESKEKIQNALLDKKQKDAIIEQRKNNLNS
tara:strand:+ start:119 stop:625 length:507 start_codon:yes stop_codon:yes gene_type:complete